MKIDSKLINWFAELEVEMDSMPLQSGDWGRHVPTKIWQKWSTRAQAAIESVFGKGSPHQINFINAYRACRGYEGEVDALKGVFLAAKSDVDGGYIFSAEKSISGELFGDFVAMAKESLDGGFKDVAAVLACAALEDSLKRYAKLNSLDVDTEVMQKVIAALKTKGLVSGAQKSLLDSMPKIRDYAMHANWEKITPQDVGSVIGFVEQFLLHNF